MLKCRLNLEPLSSELLRLRQSDTLKFSISTYVWQTRIRSKFYLISDYSSPFIETLLAVNLEDILYITDQDDYFRYHNQVYLQRKNISCDGNCHVLHPCNLF